VTLSDLKGALNKKGKLLFTWKPQSSLTLRENANEIG